MSRGGSVADWATYIGQWVALAEDGDVVAVADSPDAARHQAAALRSEAQITIVWISPHPPHVGLPAWPLLEIRVLLDEESLWLAGGPVRDLLLRRFPTDWDFVTAGSGLMAARAVADALGGAYYPLDRERATGRAIVTSPDTQATVTLDFAKMRGDTLVEDLKLRDFTVNAMALTLEGQLIDPTGGQADLQAGRLRMTYPGAFPDDPARLIRAVRLALDLPLALEPETRQCVEAQASSIAGVAPERVRDELVKIVGHVSAAEGLYQLADLGLLDHVLPEVAALDRVRLPEPSAYPTPRSFVFAMVDLLVCLESVLSESSEAVESRYPPRLVELAGAFSSVRAPLISYLKTPVAGAVSRSDLVRWAVLYVEVGRAHDGAQPVRVSETPVNLERASQIAGDRLAGLRFSRAATDFVAALVRHANAFERARSSLAGPGALADTVKERRAIYRFYRITGDVGPGAVIMVLARAIAVQIGSAGSQRWRDDLVVAQTLLWAYFKRYDEIIDPAPLLTGRDVMRLGVPRGPEVGRVLESLREKQAAGELRSTEMARDWVRRQTQTP